MSLTIDVLYRHQQGDLGFTLTPEQKIKYTNWKESFQIESAEDNFGIKIVFTATGENITGFNWKGDEIDLTDHTV